MRTPNLFDELPTPKVVNEARDRSMQLVGQKAEDTRPNFYDDARAFVLRYLREHGPTSGERLTMECRKAGIVPHDDRAFGPVYYSLAKRGVIAKVGECRRERGHGTAGGNIWARR